MSIIPTLNLLYLGKSGCHLSRKRSLKKFSREKFYFKTIILMLDFSHIWLICLIAWFSEQDQKSYSGKWGTLSQPDISQTSQPDQSCSGKSDNQANEGNIWQAYFNELPTTALDSTITVVHRTALYLTQSHINLLPYTSVNCTTLLCTALNSTALHLTSKHCTVLYHSTLYYTALHCTTQ